MGDPGPEGKKVLLKAMIALMAVFLSCQGEKGEMGDRGPTGPPGLNGTDGPPGNDVCMNAVVTYSNFTSINPRVFLESMALME